MEKNRTDIKTTAEKQSDQESKTWNHRSWILVDLGAGAVYLAVNRLVYGPGTQWIKLGIPRLFWFLMTFPVFACWIVSFSQRRRSGKIKPIELLLMLPFLPFPFAPAFQLDDGRILGIYIPLALAWEFLVLGVGYTLQNRNSRQHCTVSTTATVVGNVESIMPSPGEQHGYIPTYHPILDYYANGEWQHITCGDGQPRPLPQGLVIKIYYNPNKPEEFQFEENEKTFTEKYIPVITVGIVILLLAVSCFFFHIS